LATVWILLPMLEMIPIPVIATLYINPDHQMIGK
jgi:hypothetical protein